MSKEVEGLTSMDLSVLDTIIDSAAIHAENTISFLLIATLASIATSKVHLWRNRKKAEANFNAKTIELEGIIIATTEYQITNESHPETGNYFYRQCLTTYDKRVLEDFFPKQWVELVSENLKEARGRCNEDNPCVLLHHEEVMDQ